MRISLRESRLDAGALSKVPDDFFSGKGVFEVGLVCKSLANRWFITVIILLTVFIVY